MPGKDFNVQFKLYPEQDQAFKTILYRVDYGRMSLFFVDAPEKSNKYSYAMPYLQKIRSRGIIALAAMTVM